jgi:hypothetical protein
MRAAAGVFLAIAVVAAWVAAGAQAATPRPVPTETIENNPITGGVTIPPSDSAPGATSDKPDEVETSPPPPIEYDVTKLPVPVQRLREQLLDAARSGDIEKLRPIIDANPEIQQESFREADDPIEYLKSQSGDPQGREILAILEEVLGAGFVHADVGTPEEMFIWPYFARYPLDGLTPEQMVELFKLITWGDFEEMRNEAGGYVFYRVGIKPSGAWVYFETGD